MRITSWSDTLWHCNRSITCRWTIDCMNNHQRVRHMKYLESWRKGSFGWCGIRHGELIFVACPVCKLHVADARRKMMLMYVSIGWQKKFMIITCTHTKRIDLLTRTPQLDTWMGWSLCLGAPAGPACLPSHQKNITFDIPWSHQENSNKSWNAGLIQTYRHWIMNKYIGSYTHHTTIMPKPLCITTEASTTIVNHNHDFNYFRPFHSGEPTVHLYIIHSKPT